MLEAEVASERARAPRSRPRPPRPRPRARQRPPACRLARPAARPQPRRAGDRGRPSSPTIQPAAFSPKVVGSACCISVRPHDDVVPVRPRRASPRRRRRPARSREQRRPGARRTSIAAVSRTSWLVAPTVDAGASATASERLHDRGGTGLPISAAFAPIAATSKRSVSRDGDFPRLRRVITCSRRLARASAASTSSSARSQAPSGDRAAAPPRARRPRRASAA